MAKQAEGTDTAAGADGVGVGAATRRRAPFFGHLKWLIIASLAALEFGFDLVIEPWLRTGTALEEVVERYMAVAEVAAIGGLIWITFGQLERLEARLEQRRADLETLYGAAKAWDEQLEALHQASVAIARENAYPGVLSRIVALASQLARARYGALAEFDEDERVIQFVTYGVPSDVAALVGQPPTHRGLLRRLSGLGPVRIDDVGADADFTGFPRGHHAFRTFLGVPIRWEGQLLGHLYLGGHEGETPFSEDEERLLQMFAMEAAVAIHRSRLEREAADRLRESERRRIAMALHDSALQSLYAVGIQLDRARRRGLEHLTDTMTADVAVAAIQKSMAAIRGVLDALEERAHPGPGAALSEPARTTARLYGVELRWQGLEAIADLTQDRARELGLCLSEAVANAARHGGASEVFVHCRREDDGTVTLTIRDNGRGAPADGIREGHGLTHVRQRLAHIGGELRIAAGKEGVALECRLRPQAPATGDRGADGADSVASYDAPPVSSDAR